MTNRQLRKALLKKLNITPQALSYRVQQLKKSHPMTTEDATYIIAQQERIILDKYLDVDTVNRIRDIFQQISFPIQAKSTKRKDVKEKKSPTENTITIGKEFRATDPILPRRKLLEAKEMAAVYPLLYVLENSIREVIDLKMISLFGQNWWEQAPSKLKRHVRGRMADEQKNSWHQRRGDRPIDYLDLEELPSLMRKIEREVVPEIIPTFEWFNQLVEEVYKSRCVLCHMNPLDSSNIQAVKLRLHQWQNQVNAKRNVILSDT